MSAKDIIKDLQARKFKPVYLLHGEEPFYIDEIVNYMEANVLNDMEKSFNQTVMYGEDTDMATIINEAKRYPMMSDYQLIIVKEAQELKWDKETDQTYKDSEFILNYFEKPIPTTILVFAYKYAVFDKRKKIYKAIANSGLAFQSDLVRDYQLTGWIDAYVKQQGYQIETKASALMAEFLGANLSKIANEVEKLCLNIPKNRIITATDIQKNIGISKEYNVFELQKALSYRDIFKCNQIINYFADNPKANPVVMIMANLNSYFTKILKYHYIINKADAAKELGINPFFVKDYKAAANTFSIDKIFDIINCLREYDLKSKGLESSANTGEGELLKELLFKILH